MTLYACGKAKSKPKKGIVVPKVKAAKMIKADYDKEKYIVKYLSGNPKVASVGAKGKVTGLKMGTAVIKVRMYDKKDNKTAVKEVPVTVTVKPMIYIRHLTGKNFVRSGGKKYKNRRGIQIKIVGADKPFFLFYKSNKKKYAIYIGKKWKKNTKSVPKEKKTWIPLSGKTYYFYISPKKNGKPSAAGSSNVLKWNV